jgi:hypothetical protein
MERVKRADEWLEKCFDMTEDEKKQEKRAMDAFLKTLGNSYHLILLVVLISVIRTIGR